MTDPKEPPTCPRCSSDHPGMKYFVEPRPDGGKEPCRHPFHTKADAEGRHPKEPSLGEMLDDFTEEIAWSNPSAVDSWPRLRTRLAARVEEIANNFMVGGGAEERLRALARELRGRS